MFNTSRAMVSLSFLCTLLEKLGYIRLHPVEEMSIARRIFMFVQTSCIAFYICVHFFSTITRSTRYLPEFFQMILEDVMMITVFLAILYFQAKSERINYFIKYIDNDFNKSDKDIIDRSNFLASLIFYMILFAVACAGLGSIFESLLPMSEMDLEIQRLVYRTKHPERRQQYNIRIPFIDETESWAYEIIYLFETYLNVMFICLYSVYVTLFPVIITHFCAQYEILCKYLVMLGEEHRDSDGNVIFYSNIERNEFSIKMYKSLKQNRTALKKELVKQEDYEINYLRQIINFHQKLLGFQDKVCTMYSFSPSNFHGRIMKSSH